jgi:hypothetical protein
MKLIQQSHIVTPHRGFLAAVIVAASSLTGVITNSANAAVTTFFGEDANVGEANRLLVHPLSDAARANFLSSLVGVGTETFESFADGTVLPLVLNFPGSVGGITATLSGSGFVDVLPGVGTNGAGRYPISGTHYLDGVNASTGGTALTINFSSQIAAFGFYGTDIGDFNGTIELRLSGAVVSTVNVGNSTGNAGAGVLFFGVIDNVNTFDQVIFRNTGSGSDVFGFDDMTIGDLQQVIPPGPGTAVPEPGSALTGLLAAGLCLGRFTARRRQSRQ